MGHFRVEQKQFHSSILKMPRTAADFKCKDDAGNLDVFLSSGTSSFCEERHLGEKKKRKKKAQQTIGTYQINIPVPISVFQRLSTGGYTFCF